MSKRPIPCGRARGVRCAGKCGDLLDLWRAPERATYGIGRRPKEPQDNNHGRPQLAEKLEPAACVFGDPNNQGGSNRSNEKCSEPPKHTADPFAHHQHPQGKEAATGPINPDRKVLHLQRSRCPIPLVERQCYGAVRWRGFNESQVVKKTPVEVHFGNPAQAREGAWMMTIAEIAQAKGSARARVSTSESLRCRPPLPTIPRAHIAQQSTDSARAHEARMLRTDTGTPGGGAFVKGWKSTARSLGT